MQSVIAIRYAIATGELTPRNTVAASLDAIAERMARDRSLTLPDWAEGRAAEIGLRVRIRAEPEPEVLPSP